MESYIMKKLSLYLIIGFSYVLASDTDTARVSAFLKEYPDIASHSAIELAPMQSLIRKIDKNKPRAQYIKEIFNYLKKYPQYTQAVVWLIIQNNPNLLIYKNRKYGPFGIHFSAELLRNYVNHLLAASPKDLSWIKIRKALTQTTFENKVRGVLYPMTEIALNAGFYDSYRDRAGIREELRFYLNSKEYKGAPIYTLLLPVAILHGLPDVVELLLQKGANPHYVIHLSKSKRPLTILDDEYYAAQVETVTMLEYAQERLKEAQAVHDSALEKDLEQVIALLKQYM